MRWWCAARERRLHFAGSCGSVAIQSREGHMGQARLTAAALGAVAMFCAGQACLAADHLKLAVGGRGVGETFVTEIGNNAGIFKKQNLELDLFYTDGGGETQQAVIAGSAQIGIASGFLGAI